MTRQTIVRCDECNVVMSEEPIRISENAHIVVGGQIINLSGDFCRWEHWIAYTTKLVRAITESPHWKPGKGWEEKECE